MDLRLPLPDGTRPWFHLVLHVILDQRDRTRELGYVGKLTNINRIKREATEWQKRANTDALTQLYNRAGTHILFEELLLEGKDIHMPLTVAFMDIDHFKSLNDTMGHEAGDQILTAFGQSIRRLFRPDDIVSRFGGDEFLVVMKNMGDPAFAREGPGPSAASTFRSPVCESRWRSAAASVWPSIPKTVWSLTICCARRTRRSISPSAPGGAGELLRPAGEKAMTIMYNITPNPGRSAGFGVMCCREQGSGLTPDQWGPLRWGGSPAGLSSDGRASR